MLSLTGTLNIEYICGLEVGAELGPILPTLLLCSTPFVKQSVKTDSRAAAHLEEANNALVGRLALRVRCCDGGGVHL